MENINKNQVCWDICGTIGILTINTPPENKILKPEFIPIELLAEYVNNPSLRGLIITGVGRHFSSGADIDGIRSMTNDLSIMTSQMQKGHKLLNFLQNLQLPTVAAISGACFGAGLEIALACHIRICTENSLFAFPESALGLIPGLGGCSRLLKLTSVEASMQLLFSGDVIDAQKAKNIGIVDQIVPNKQVKEFSIEYLNKLVADRPIKVIHSIVKSINNARFLPMEEALQKEAVMFCDLAVNTFGKEI